MKDKLAVYLPYDMVKALELKEGEEIDFLPRGTYYMVAKKSALADMMIGMAQPAAKDGKPQQPGISQEELAVLKKIDTIRYNDRTKERLKKLLDIDERKILVRLIKKKYVSAFKKQGETEFKYGIAKSIYNKFLMRTGQQTATQQASQQTRTEPRKWEQKLGSDTSYVDLLESNGYIVIPNQIEATNVSKSLEASIRGGMVVGIRAFNRKYYIALKSFVAKNAPKIMKLIQQRARPVEEISKETDIDEEGARAVLYILSESGEVAEVKRDVFRAVS